MASFVGMIYDFDYIQNSNWVQVLLLDADGAASDSLISREPRILSLCATAIALNREVQVRYELPTSAPVGLIEEVSLSGEDCTNVDGGQFCVKHLRYNDLSGRCEVVFDPNPVQPPLEFAFTRDIRAQRLLETALAAQRPVSYLDLDPNSGEINRVKINR